MYYNHPIHGDPTPEDVKEFRNERWTCKECGRSHPGAHEQCWHCHPTGYRKPNNPLCAKKGKVPE